MSYLLHPEPYVKRLCHECGLFFLTPQSHPFTKCPDCIEYARPRRHRRKKYKHEQDRFRAYYLRRREDILARKLLERRARQEIRVVEPEN